MKNKMKQISVITGAMLMTSAMIYTASGQQTEQTAPPQVTSPEVSADRTITFRIFAPGAEAVRLNGGDIPGNSRGAEMSKKENGVWEVKLGPVQPGAYRYTFDVDGVSVVDPRNTSISESNENVWSLVYVPGSDTADVKEVPHGAIAEVTYYSESLQRFRRMHIYTPTGYESGNGDYPVFYLLHGASDSDDSWSTVGRAGFIMDNLIAAGKAEPMMVVMPAGHTGPFRFGDGGASFRSSMTEFQEDFLNDIMPYVEKHYRVLPGKKHRAIAGLSMGGAQTLNIAIPNLDKFAYIGVFSSGIFGINNEDSSPSWEEQHKAALDDSDLKKGLNLVWFATGKEDFLIDTSRATVDMLKEHGFDVSFKESPGGHTWINWRNYLSEFAPLLFSKKSENPGK